MTIHHPFLPASARALRRIGFVGFGVLAVIAHATGARAEWIPNGTQVVPWNGVHPVLLDDGSGGANLEWDHQGRIRREHAGSDGRFAVGASCDPAGAR